MSVTSEVVLEELWRNARLSIKADYDVQPEVLKVGDAVIGTLGNFSAAIGKAKSKKQKERKNRIRSYFFIQASYQ